MDGLSSGAMAAAPTQMPIALPLGLLGVAVLLMASMKSRETTPPAPAVKGLVGYGPFPPRLSPAERRVTLPGGLPCLTKQWGTASIDGAPSKGPTRGAWPYDGLPFRVTFDGRLFQRSPKVPRGVAGYYREVRGPGEVAVTAAGRFVAV